MRSFRDRIARLDAAVMRHLGDGVCQYLSRTGQVLADDVPVIVERAMYRDRQGRTFDVLMEKPGRRPGQLVGRSPYLQAVQAMGGAGFMNDSPVSRIMRDAKLMEIGAGTSEIRRMLIGRELFAETM